MQTDLSAGVAIGRTGNARLEAFVDAAFAFAVTLLVISAEKIPSTPEALLLAPKAVPAFAASFAMVAMFWYAHVCWSRRFHLQTAPAVLLSLLLVFLVLVYVYPLRLLLGTFFAWISAGWLPMPLRGFQLQDVVFMYLVYAAAFCSMSACMAGLYFHAWRLRRFLYLDTEEASACAGDVTTNLFFLGAGLLSALAAALLPEVPMAWQLALPGFLYFALSFTGLVDRLGRRWALSRIKGAAVDALA